MTKPNIYDREIMEMLLKACLPLSSCVWFTMENKSMVEGYREMAESLIKLEQNLYSPKPPMVELDEFEKAIKAKDEHIDLCRKTNTNLAAKCWGYIEQLKAKEKEIAILHELIQKQHVTQKIKILVCERCGKELQQ